MRSLACSVASCFVFVVQGQWSFTGDTSATWEQAVARYAELDRLHHEARLMEIGSDDDGSPIHLFVISDGSGFTPDSIRAASKNILWITNGIHPGEPDGVDASLMLAQALLEDDHLMGLLAKTSVCIVPMYNVSGAKRRGAFSRANQNGPRVYGFRGNARNLDLNRDFVKMDARNTWALETALVRWDPDVYFETHVSDGADHQYVMELLTTQKDKLDGGLGAFMSRTLVPGLYEWMNRKNILMCPYFETEGEKPEDGLVTFYDSPRYSTGYNALFDRIGILSESHMLKPYADRVNATLQLMLATLYMLDRHGAELRESRARAKRNTAELDELGLNWVLDTMEVERRPWLGWQAISTTSAVTGLERLRYNHDLPTRTSVPWHETYRPSLIERKPLAYLIPEQWHEVIARLEANGVMMERLATDRAFTVERDSIASFKTIEQPFEGHYLHRRVVAERRRMAAIGRIGDVLVRMGRPTDRFVMETLECEAEDGYFAWNFFDAVLTQKEWFSDYVFEDIATDLLAKDPALKRELDLRREANAAFAADAWAQLYFIYTRSPYFEEGFRAHPVLRIVGE